jgi:hypothetical protein
MVRIDAERHAEATPDFAQNRVARLEVRIARWAVGCSPLRSSEYT